MRRSLDHKLKLCVQRPAGARRRELTDSKVERKGKRTYVTVPGRHLLRRQKAAFPWAAARETMPLDDKRFLILTQERFHQSSPPLPSAHEEANDAQSDSKHKSAFTHSLRLAAITSRGAACSSGAHQQPPPWEEIIHGSAALPD